MLTPERKGEIAYLCLKEKIRQEKVRLAPEFRRELGNVARAIEVPIKELDEFAEMLFRDLVSEMFANPRRTTAVEPGLARCAP